MQYRNMAAAKKNRVNNKPKITPIASNKDINLIVISDLVSTDERLKEAFNDVKVIIEGLI